MAETSLLASSMNSGKGKDLETSLSEEHGCAIENYTSEDRICNDILPRRNRRYFTRPVTEDRKGFITIAYSNERQREGLSDISILIFLGINLIFGHSTGSSAELLEDFNKLEQNFTTPEFYYPRKV